MIYVPKISQPSIIRIKQKILWYVYETVPVRITFYCVYYTS